MDVLGLTERHKNSEQGHFTTLDKSTFFKSQSSMISQGSTMCTIENCHVGK